VADVVARVEVQIVDPDRPALPVRDGGQRLAVAGHELEAADDVLGELGDRRGRALEDEHRGDVGVERRAVLQLEQVGVEHA
jgi:hypothetical protein